MLIKQFQIVRDQFRNLQKFGGILCIFALIDFFFKFIEIHTRIAAYLFYSLRCLLFINHGISDIYDCKAKEYLSEIL